MLKIGKTYLHHTDGQVRLCADISLNGRGTTLWFGVDEAQADCLCAQRSDAFVMALLPTAMRGGYTIQSESPVSRQLHYQLTNYLIPTLCQVGDLYHPVQIHAPLRAEPVKNAGGVGTGFSGGVDCLYTVMTHGADSAYPLTHIAVFNVGAFDGSEYRKNFQNACADATAFAKEQALNLICLDSNLAEALPEDFLEVCSYRNLAGALALQGLFSVYLLSSGIAFSKFYFNLGSGATYDMLSVQCARTENLTFYSSGGEVHRQEKLKALADWQPAHRWLHPCFRNRLTRGNCGKCKKCIHTMTELYAYGVLDRFAPVFDVAAYEANFSQNIGYLLTIQDQPFYQTALQLLKDRKIPIPAEAYEEAEKLRNQGRNTGNTKAEQQDALRVLAQNLRKAKLQKTTPEDKL